MNGLVNIVHAFVQILEFRFIGSKKRFLFVSKWFLGIGVLFERIWRDRVSLRTARSLGRALQKLILFRGNRWRRGGSRFLRYWIEGTLKQGIIGLGAFKLFGIVTGLGVNANFRPRLDIKLWIYICIHIARLLFDYRIDRFANVLAGVRLGETVAFRLQYYGRRESVAFPISRDT